VPVVASSQICRSHDVGVIAPLRKWTCAKRNAWGAVDRACPLVRVLVRVRVPRQQRALWGAGVLLDVGVERPGLLQALGVLVAAVVRVVERA